MSTEQSAKALDLDAIEAAARACTALNFDSAKDEQPQSGSLECPHCDGTGSVELEADYCNFDGKALGVQFYGIGPEFGAAERFVRAANPAAVLELVRLARLSTPPQSSAQGAPAGWKLVPIEPTPEMLVGLASRQRVTRDLGLRIWRHMLAAAPLVALTACSGRVEPEDFALADQQCANHGGTQSVARYEHGKTITIVCKNGMLIEVRKHNVEPQHPQTPSRGDSQ